MAVGPSANPSMLFPMRTESRSLRLGIFTSFSGGATFDTRWDDYNTPITNNAQGKLFGHQDWSCHAERAIHVVDGRFYSIEIAIPFSAFGPPPKPGDTWRLNFYSFKNGQALSLAWSPIKGQGNFHKSSRFGRIQFH